jgi:hypothetical protein
VMSPAYRLRNVRKRHANLSNPFIVHGVPLTHCGIAA